MEITKKIAYDCKKATFLIEKQQIGRITFREKAELKMHLTGCSICRIFQRQSVLINRMLSKDFIDQHTDIVLDIAFKSQLQEKINAILSNN